MLRCITGSENGYKNVTHLILDEVHERELNTDLLLIAVKDAIATNPDFKVILMSATLNAAEFSQYFGNCPVIEVPGRLFDVEVFYLEDVLMKTSYIRAFVESQCIGMSPEAKKERLIMAYNNTIDPKKEVDHILIQHVIGHIHELREEGSILVFLPGYQDIMMQLEYLKNSSKRRGIRNYRIIILHSGVDGGSDVFKAMPQGVRKILLSTNIAETSVTIDDVVCDIRFKIILFIYNQHLANFLNPISIS